MEDETISRRSTQGQYTELFCDNLANLDRQIEDSLEGVNFALKDNDSKPYGKTKGWCRKVGGKLENWRKLLIVKHSERRCAAAERSLRHETSYGIDVAQSIFR